MDSTIEKRKKGQINQELIFKVIGPERAHKLFISPWAKKGLKLPLTNFKISELITQSVQEDLTYLQKKPHHK